MIEKVPFPLKLDDGMMRRPPNDRVKDISPKNKWTGGVLTSGIGDKVGIASRIGEIVGTIILVHPGSLEKSPVVVVGKQWLTVLIGDGYFFSGTVKTKHIR